MTVGDAKRIVVEWAQFNLPSWPRVVGALLAGSVNEKADAEPWTGGSDVDVWVFQEGKPTERPPKFPHAGLILEVATKPADLLADDNRVLDDPHLAPHLAGGQIVYDPTCTLASLAERVRPRYAGLNHLRARMKWAADNSRSKYGWCVKAKGDGLVGPLCVFVLGVRNTAAIAAIAALKNPTLRRCMAVQRNVLERFGYGELHEQALAVVGSGRLTQDDVREMVRPLPDLFRRACAVARTPFWAIFELEPAAESLFINGTVEMIDAGDHRGRAVHPVHPLLLPPGPADRWDRAGQGSFQPSAASDPSNARH